MRFIYRYIGLNDKQLHEQVISDLSRPLADQQFTQLCGARVLWDFPIVVRPYMPFTMLTRVSYLHEEGYKILAVLPTDENGVRARIVYEDNSQRYEEECAVASTAEWEEMHIMFRNFNLGFEKNGASPDDLEPVS